MSTNEFDRYVELSVEQTFLVRSGIYVGVSNESFAAAAAVAWEAAKAIAKREETDYPKRLVVVSQWVNGTNPITDYGVVMRNPDQKPGF